MFYHTKNPLFIFACPCKPYFMSFKSKAKQQLSSKATAGDVDADDDDDDDSQRTK